MSEKNGPAREKGGSPSETEPFVTPAVETVKFATTSSCRHDGPRTPVPIPIRCWDCGKVVVVAPGTMCATCGLDFRKASGWRLSDQRNPVEVAAWEAHYSNGDHERALEAKESAVVAKKERAAQEEERAETTRREAEVEARRRAEEATAAERAREAEERRRREESERAERDAAEERRARIDRALLAGEEPRSVMYSTGGVTEAQVRARQTFLAKLSENRGRLWAELALDKEIVRLRVQEGLTRDAVKRELGVGSGRIARVERLAGLGTKRGDGRTGAGLNRDSHGTVRAERGTTAGRNRV